MRASLVCLLPLLLAPRPSAADDAYDVVVYGGTSGGVVAAVKAAQLGKTVALVEPGKHLGGLTSGGLGATDIGNKAAIGGLSREFYRALGAHYGQPEMWTFEPHVAEEIMDRWAERAGVAVLKQERLDLTQGVEKDGPRIVSIALESGRRLRAKMFIDASYEGDLMAKSGVSYHVGREANAAYGETLNGVQTRQATKHQFTKPVDPYITPGDAASGLLPGVHSGEPGEEGAGDQRVQAYNFRMCLTDVRENQLPFPKPAGYDPLRYELLLRYLHAGVFDVLGNTQRMPNGKTDTNNNGAFSTDNIGMNYEYPDGDYATREKIFQEHVAYQQGLMWFLVNDPRVPEQVRREVGRWGLAKDEFQDTGGWPHQLYVREARRMVSDYVMSQHNCQGQRVAEEAVGLAAYGMDSHNTQRYVRDGRAVNEGDVQVGGFAPYPIAFRSIVPRAAECENLLVPVCLSASHISYGSIRMEPVFMVLGQSAATAACQAIDDGVPVQQIDVSRLREKLLEDGQILEWTGASKGIDPAKLQGIVVDDSQAVLTGDWTASTSLDGYVGRGYLHDGHADQGKKSARFEIKFDKPGGYDARLLYVPNGNRASNVPVTVSLRGRATTFSIDQRSGKAPGENFAALGFLAVEAGDVATITISNAGANGYVIADAVQLNPRKETSKLETP